MYKTPPLRYSVGMAKLPYPAALVILLACGVALGGGIPISSLVPCGIYDTAEIQDVAGKLGLVNTNSADSRYSVSLDFSTMQSPHLTVDISVSLGASSNAVWLTLGDSTSAAPDFLRLGCEDGRWTILVGDQVRAFDEELPPLLGVGMPRTFRLHLVTSIDGGYSSSIKVYEDGVLQPTTLHISPSLWQGAGGDPSTWDTATVSLRGLGATLLSMQCRTVRSPTFIFIR